MMNEIKSRALILAAGGSSSRFGYGNKLLENLDGKPVFVHSLELAAPLVGEIVMAVPATLKTLFRDLSLEYVSGVRVSFVEGGVTRPESVYNALKTLDSARIKYVAIHDAARPYAARELFERCFAKCAETGGAVACHKICDTVKVSDSNGCVSSTIDRTCLWAAETPQVFSLVPLLEAYRLALESPEKFTDDCGIMERFSTIRPSIVENRLPNGKITFAEDLRRR